MEPSSHLSVVLDLSPLQWHLSSSPNDNQSPLTFRSFLAQTLAFLNSHLAFKHENTLAVYGALPGKRCAQVMMVIYRVTDLFLSRLNSVLLYSSSDVTPDGTSEPADANIYLPFKSLDTTLTKRIVEELDALPDFDEERELNSYSDKLF